VAGGPNAKPIAGTRGEGAPVGHCCFDGLGVSRSRTRFSAFDGERNTGLSDSSAVTGLGRFRLCGSLGTPEPPTGLVGRLPSGEWFEILEGGATSSDTVGVGVDEELHEARRLAHLDRWADAFHRALGDEYVAAAVGGVGERSLTVATADRPSLNPRWSGQRSRMDSPSFPLRRADALVLFGITGDLGQSKLIPALLELCGSGRLDDVPVIGVGRSERSDEDIKDLIVRAAEGAAEGAAGCEADDSVDPSRLDLHYVSGDAAASATFDEIADVLGDARLPVVYAALPPAVFGDAARAIASSRMSDETRFVVEKPFGTDVPSARELHDEIADVLGSDGLLIVDHFLAKAAVENLLTVRTSNALFDRVLDRHSVDRIAIDLRERGDVADRGSFYEQVGVIDDVVQNHLIQLAALALMERPADHSDEAYHDERAATIESMRVLPDSVGLGQYHGYRHHEDVADDSNVATFCSFTMTVDSERWRHVPIEVVTGKALDESNTSVTFELDGPGDTSIRFGIKPDPTISIGLNILDTGADSPPRGHHAAALRRVDAELCGPSEHGDLGDLGDYATLLDDALDGSRRHFAQIDDVLAAWRLVADLSTSNRELHFYAPGSSGPGR
jgi:glucose-6-phosphate 1-dehydrogenase